MMMLLMVALPAVAFAATSGPAPIPNPPSFQVATNSLTLCKGVVNYVPITVSNLGKFNGSISMESLQLGISGSKSIVQVANGSTNILTVKPNSSVTVNMPVFVTLNSSTLISADIAVNYNYLNYYSDSELRNVSFGTMYCPSQLSVSISPSVLTSGKIENATVVLKNKGNTTLGDISFKTSMSSQQGQVLTQQPVSIGSIPPFGTAKVNESLFINSTSQTFPINVSASLYNGSKLVQILDSVTVLSSGIINLTPTGTTVSPTAPTSGSIFSISFVLTNLGTTGAAAVTVTALPPSGITAFGSNSVFVGTIAVDSQTPVTLSLTSSGTSSGVYSVPIKISYLNNLRQQINGTISVPVTIYSANGLVTGKGGIASSSGSGGTTVYRKSSGGGGVILIILLVAVVALAALFYRERRRHRKPAK
jgi:hypothetical protein